MALGEGVNRLRRSRREGSTWSTFESAPDDVAEEPGVDRARERGRPRWYSHTGTRCQPLSSTGLSTGVAVKRLYRATSGG